MPSNVNRIQSAINVDREYFTKCLLQRNPGPDAAGSVFDSPQTVESILAVADQAKDANDPNISAPAVGLVLPIPGTFGIVALADLDDGALVTLADPKETGKVEATLPGQPARKVAFTTLLLGPSKDGVEQVWTLFPGPSVAPSEVDATGNVGQQVTVAEARALGLTSAKLTG